MNSWLNGMKGLHNNEVMRTAGQGQNFVLLSSFYDRLACGLMLRIKQISSIETIMARVISIWHVLGI